MFKMLHFLKMLFFVTTYYPFIALFDFAVEKKKEYRSKYLTIQLNYSNCKLYRISEHKISHSKNIIYFSNHRSWADFFIDNIVT